MFDLDRFAATAPLLDDLERRRLHADLQRISLEMHRFAAELERALAQAAPSSGSGPAVDAMLSQVQRALHCVVELDGALAILSEPECRGC